MPSARVRLEGSQTIRTVVERVNWKVEVIVRPRSVHGSASETRYDSILMAHAELGGHSYGSHRPGSLLRTLPARGLTGCAIISSVV
jgi:hypothetical protein